MADIRVLIVDDHPIICKGIRDLLAPAVGITVVGEAHTGAEALQKIEELKPDVVLLDMKLPDMLYGQVLRAPAFGATLKSVDLAAAKAMPGVVVVHEGEFVGVMTERDYSRKVILNGKSSTDTLVGDIMTIDFPAVTPNDSIDYCMTLMSENKLRYLPVFENHKVCSIISMSDVVTETIQGQAETISQLKDYLHSSL